MRHIVIWHVQSVRVYWLYLSAWIEHEDIKEREYDEWIRLCKVIVDAEAKVLYTKESMRIRGILQWKM